MELEVGRSIDVADALDRAPLRGLHFVVIVLCALVITLDGFDVQVMGIAAPLVAQEWGAPVASFGPALSASLMGLMAGALLGGPLGDRYGRKAMIVVAFAIVGVATLATAYARNIDELFLCRLVTGVGLGGTMPNVLALTSEYMPKRHRNFLTAVIMVGLPIGGALGGVIARDVIDAWSWRGLFVVGGVLPLALLPVIVLALPESLSVLVRRSAASAHAKRLLRKTAGAPVGEDDTLAVHGETSTTGNPVALLRQGRALGTLLLWVIFLCNLFIVYLLLSWLPAALRGAGFSMQETLAAVAMFNLGGGVGGFALAFLADRLGAARVLIPAYLLGVGLVVALGLGIESRSVLFWTIAGVGLICIGSQFCINAVAAAFYPAEIKSTGLGWALGLGRIGAILGPLIGALALTGGADGAAPIFLLASAPFLACAIALALFARLRSGRGNDQVARQQQKAVPIT